MCIRDRFDYARQAISVRAMDYLLKPYNEQELILSLIHIFNIEFAA